ncbi:C4-dicarboxylate transporter/malic acid transport protein [Penicillium verhagenii]|uniref:C4-dicarboxylate transporter/malic acid transport protein n=1 Tax=Penicillium verhagenii TaxID=1562060 RepID=UPI002545AC82|nr:C4-dicarboxylate transporter/malic acid transport protein [Penicillium verhagenii]KAJ5928714.1 C4-dicarboxylate transporter/malic acid transport protein [Penicillium verhagenii]
MSEQVDTPQLQPPNSPLSLALWNFTSQWFLVPQGTGILAVILARLDYQFNGLQILAKIVWIYTIVLFGLCLIIYLLRVHIYPKHALHELRTNLIETSCLSSIPIVYTSILQLAVLQYGDRAGLAIYILWWRNAAIATIAALGIPYIQLKIQAPGVQRLPPAVLLPFIAIITSAAGAGVISRQSHVSPRLQVPAIIVAYLQLGIGLAVAASYAVLVMFQHFNQVHSVAEKVFQDMILCGPFGQGAFALQVLGEAVEESFGAYHRGKFLTAKAADTIGVTSQFLGLLTWGYGVFWWCFAILSICHTLGAQPRGGRKPPFSLAAWSIIFPWGVFTNAAVELGKIMDSPAFAVVSTGLLLIMLVMWIFNQVLTLRGILTGRILGVEHWREREQSLDSFRGGDKDA